MRSNYGSRLPNQSIPPRPSASARPSQFLVRSRGGKYGILQDLKSYAESGVWSRSLPTTCQIADQRPRRPEPRRSYRFSHSESPFLLRTSCRSGVVGPLLHVAPWLHLLPLVERVPEKRRGGDVVSRRRRPNPISVGHAELLGGPLTRLESLDRCLKG